MNEEEKEKLVDHIADIAVADRLWSAWGGDLKNYTSVAIVEELGRRGVMEKIPERTYDDKAVDAGIAKIMRNNVESDIKSRDAPILVDELVRRGVIDDKFNVLKKEW